jgi:hypothetical protein
MSLFVSSDPPFDWCHRKLKRAREHLNTLDYEITKWKETHPGHLDRQCNAEATRYSVFLHITDPPDLERWATIAAECFHDLRAALDQFPYAVAIFQSKTDPPPDHRILQLPLCDDPDTFADKREQRRIRSLSAPVRTAIERIRPYNRRNPDIPPLLSLLRDFDDADKHRLPHLTVLGQTEGKLDKLRENSRNSLGSPRASP